MVTIREPVLEDAEALGRIHVRAWQAAYRGGLMPDDYLDDLSVDERVGMWRNGLTNPPRERRARFVAEADGALFGFILTGPADGQEDSGEGEVYALNVDPGAWGRGAGRALLTAGVEALVANGFASLLLWVHPGNARARRFYEQAGWEADGAERLQEVHGIEVPEVRYHRQAPSR